MSNCFYKGDGLEMTVSGADYVLDVEAKATYRHEAATSWQPEEESFDIDEVDAVWRKNGIKVEPTEEMEDALWELLEENQDWFEFDEGPDYEDGLRKFDRMERGKE